MRLFSILVIFVIAFGGAAVLYEQESRKVKGVLTQITELQAELGDLQAEVNKLRGELEAARLAERRRPGLKEMAASPRRAEPTQTVTARRDETETRQSRALIASDVTTAPPAIRRDAEGEEDPEWNRPTVDAEEYRRESAAENDAAKAVDPYQ
ncbi:hypothetical protein [Microbulbifer guangxiensis]|uniref:hypothetical protein n=1 Tax=Microbulbifer guangxiensis TaxID=2904249 RepID=UPI001F2CCED1|nr:hypothetical protein [Microbulbifer guangxiensis]